MIALQLKEIVTYLKASCFAYAQQDDSVCVQRVVIDSRKVQPGDLFVAIVGDQFDGHDFIEQALEQGASAVVIQESNLKSKPSGPYIAVDNTRHALGLIAKYVRERVAPQVVGITGSSGKTTVKEMIASILITAFGEKKVLATQGNFNNDIGVPLTLLRLQQEHEYAVLELGANHRGEIAYTSGLARPQVAVINNIAPAHVEGFGDICGVALAKTEIFKELPADGVGITPAGTEFDGLWQRELEQHQHWQFQTMPVVDGVQPQAGIYASECQLDATGCARFVAHIEEQTQVVELGLPGLHNVSNALAALAVCYALHVPLEQIAQGLNKLQPVPGRMWVHKITESFTLIDDSYNANVGSARAAIELLKDLSGPCLLVLGDMGELGHESRAYHEEIGLYAQEAGIEKLYTFGVLSQSASDVYPEQYGRHFEQKQPLIEALIQEAHHAKQLTVLVKGSRSSRMEHIIDALLEHWANGL